MKESSQINLISEISNKINEIKDIDLLLEEILTQVRRFLNADAGSIYIREGDSLKFSYTQNDTLEQRLGPGKKLIYKFFSIPINEYSIAGYVAKTGAILNIQDVYKLDKNLPFKFDSHFDKISDYRTRSMITIPMLNQKRETIGVIQLINAKDKKGRIVPFPKQVEFLLRAVSTTAGFAIERAQLTREIIMKMIKMAELRDPKETGAHVNRVGSYAAEIYEAWARSQGTDEKELTRTKDTLRIAAMLHDVGKIAISDTILKKPGKLTEEEFAIMKTHTYIGARLFDESKSDFEKMAKEIALNHHERYDGLGYPGHVDPETGLPLPGYEIQNGKARPKKGDEIPLFGRIVAIADVYDALSSKRVYKEAWDSSKTVEEIKRCAGTNFDPVLVDAFLTSLPQLEQMRLRYPDE